MANFRDMTDDELIIYDGRQSETAAAIQRGVSRMLSAAGFAVFSALGFLDKCRIL